MVKLDRIDQPIFAGNNATADDNVAVFGSMKTSPSYTMDLPTLLASADYQKGWQNAVVVGYAPFLEEMNGVQYGFSYQLAYLQQQGIPEWTGTTTYYKGSLAKLNTASGCQLYASKIDNNTGNLLTDTNSWQLVFDTSVSFARDSDVVKLTGNQSIAGVKTFSSVTEFNGGVGTNEGGEIHLAAINATSSYKKGIVDVSCSTASDETTHCVRLRMQDNTGICVFNDGHATLPSSPATSDNSTNIATTAFVKNNLKDFSVNISGKIDLALSLDTSYTFPSSGLFILTAYVKGQSDPTIEVRMKDTAGADSTSSIICEIAHHSGASEYNKIPFSIYVQKGQSIYLQRSGGGTVSVSHTYLFPVML
jgi:hypothetical protein